jgi:hypothetical protein
MKMKSFVAGITPVVLMTSVLFVSCQKNLNSKSQQATITDEQKATHVAALTNLVDVADIQTVAFATDPVAAQVLSQLSGSCPPITTDAHPGVYPDTITVDWGTGCTSGDITRSGKTITVFSGDMSQTGSQARITYDNFFVNGVQFEGMMKIDHNTRNQDPQNVYRLTQKDRKLTQPNGDYVIYNGERRLVKRDTSSEYPGFPWGYFKLTGSVTGDELKGSDSYQWTDSIDLANPVIYDFCDFIVKGHLHIDFNNNQPSWDVDYGSKGDCDDQATLTSDGNTTTVTLPLEP